MKRLLVGIAAGGLIVVGLAQVHARGQILPVNRPSPFDGGNVSPIHQLLSVFLTLPFALGEVDLGSLGVSDAALETIGPQMAATSSGTGQMLIVDDDLQNCPNAEFTTIQSAVTVAQPGAQIKVCPGVYIEQVTIPAAKDGLTLFSEGAFQAVIKAPPAMIGDKAIVLIRGAQNVTLRHFTISGPGGGPCDSIRWGVRVDSGGSALITDNHITEIRDTPFSGCQNGIGVLVGRNLENTAGVATVVHNLIDRYQKGAVVVDGLLSGPPVSMAEVAFNEIVGIGPTVVIAQNGVQVSRGAQADVHHNKISRNNYALPLTVGEGIILFQAGADARAHHNYSFLNDDGVGIFGTSGMEISYNRVEQNDFDGIYAGSDTAANEIAYNKARDNVEHDCHDDTPGMPSTNSWIKDMGRTENKVGLCKGATVQ